MEHRHGKLITDIRNNISPRFTIVIVGIYYSTVEMFRDKGALHTVSTDK